MLKCVCNLKKVLGKMKTKTYLLFGVHAVISALENPRREVEELLVTSNAMPRIQPYVEKGRHPQISQMDVKQLNKRVGEETVHQGVLAKVCPLPPVSLEDILEEEKRPLLFLDQVTDPHNIGAILRSAAAFNAAALVVQDRHTPEENGVMAKTASGALDVVPLIRVTNLAQALDTVKQAGYWAAGLDGLADQAIGDTKLGADTALVLGAEGRGLRRLTAEHCDMLVKLPISERMESLNVSNAAAVALYALGNK